MLTHYKKLRFSFFVIFGGIYGAFFFQKKSAGHTHRHTHTIKGAYVTEVKCHPVEIIAKMLKSFWAVNKTGLNSYSVSNIMMIDFKLNRQFWKQLFLNATKQKSVDIEMLQHLGIQVLSAIIIHFVIVWPISTAFLWFSCDRLDWTRWSGKLQPFVYIRFEKPF